MSASNETKTTRKRAPHKRSRLGCQTCRIRRIRCDQTRPACQKCTLTGRSCDGYPPVCEGRPTSNTFQVIALAPTSCIVKTTKEQRSLRYFQLYTAPQFAGYFEDEFWCRLVLQTSMREPCVHHAVIALGSLHEAFQVREGNSRSRDLVLRTTSLSRHACDHYTKAIGLLNAHILTEGWSGLTVSLLCCILCVGFEWLRGCYSDAHTHLINGLQVLCEWAKDNRSDTGTSICSPTGHYIRNTIAPVYTRLALQSRTFARSPLPWESSILPTIQLTDVTSLKSARNTLVAVLGQIYLTTPRSSRSTTYHQNPTKATRYFESLLDLSRWFDSYASYISNASLSPETKPHIAMIEVTHLVAKLMLATGHSEDQMQFDDFLPTFQAMLDHAEVLASWSAPSFSVDIAIVPVVYFLVRKCRDPTTRRRAIALLTSTARREGVWDGLASARLAQEIVEIEEGDLAGVYEAGDVDEGSRIRNLDFDTDLMGRSISMKFLRQGAVEWSPERVLTW